MKVKPDPRHNLPKRRLTETRRIETPDGHTIHLSVGFDPNENGRPREVFYSAGFKSGSALEFQIQDACVLISLLLQHGHRPDDIAKSLARTERPDGAIAYVQSWLKVLRDDKRAIVKAAAAAQRSADYLMEKAGEIAEAA